MWFEVAITHFGGIELEPMDLLIRPSLRSYGDLVKASMKLSAN
ncbi:hypothetical protein PMI35_04599 [Pseudomonas sp. GM78]|nr:hypothetical protein PMI35_04599 [Pseudomonas sp. GM78]